MPPAKLVLLAAAFLPLALPMPVRAEEKPDDSKKIAQLEKNLAEARKKLEEQGEEITHLREDIAAIREEMENIRSGYTKEILAAAPLLPPGARAGQVVAADELSKAYQQDLKGSDTKYRGTFLTVVGVVDAVETGDTAGDGSIKLKTAQGLPPVRCYFNRDPAFPVEFIRHEGKVIWQATRETAVQVGQRVVVGGTCKGKDFDVKLINCHLEGVRKPSPTPTPSPAKK